MLTVTNNGSVGYAFYQVYEFTCSHDVNPLYLRNENLNSYIAKFLITAIEQQRICFEYARKWRPLRMKKSKILLPVTSNGKPDFVFMESYMRQKEKQLLEQYKIRIDKIKSVVPLSQKEWKEFKLIDFFDFVKGDQNNMASIKAGSIPLVSAKKSDNGYKDFAQQSKKLYRGNSLSLNNDGDGGAGISFYQPIDYLLDSHVTALYPKSKLNKFALLYISRAITAQRNKFGHGYSINNQRLKVFKLMLPTNDKGEPDFVYMENYMKALENDKLKQYLDYKKLNTTSD